MSTGHRLDPDRIRRLADEMTDVPDMTADQAERLADLFAQPQGVDR